MKSITMIIAKLVCITILLFAIAIHFGLGYQLPLVLIVGLLLAMFLTKSDQANLNRKYLAPLFVLISYLFLFTSSWLLITYYHIGQTYTQRTHAMTWENKGKNNNTVESEIVFEFVDFTGNYEGIFSDRIASYLEKLQSQRIDITFEVSRTFGCWNGYRMIQIGDIQKLLIRDGYSRSIGAPKRSPWDEFYGKWWCP
jgi:predicted membrane protein